METDEIKKVTKVATYFYDRRGRRHYCYNNAIEEFKKYVSKYKTDNILYSEYLTETAHIIIVADAWYLSEKDNLVTIKRDGI